MTDDIEVTEEEHLLGERWRLTDAMFDEGGGHLDLFFAVAGVLLDRVGVGLRMAEEDVARPSIVLSAA